MPVTRVLASRLYLWRIKHEFVCVTVSARVVVIDLRLVSAQKLLSCTFATMKFKEEHDDDIVISGIGGYFPDADNVDEFWDKLMSGVELSTVDNPRWIGEF